MFKITKIPRIILKLFSAFSAISLFFCFLSIYISPAKMWVFAYFGLLFQYLLFVNIVFIVVWIIKRDKKFISLHVMALIPSLFFIGHFFRISGEKNAEQDANNIKVLTYNVQGFQIPYQHNTTQKQIADFINEENPDIISLQEFYVNNKVTEELLYTLLSKYKYHKVFYSVKRQNTSYGVAIFSRYPIKMMLEIPFQETANAAMYADIDINGKIVRIYNVHFQSIKLNLPKLLSGKNRIGEIEEVSSRLKTAFIKRAGQVDIVAKHIKVSPYPVVVCGDFNDTPISYTYKKIRGNKIDTFCEAGKGMPSTHRLSFLPSFRIDYIFHDKLIKTKAYSVHNVDYSDHYPVVSVIDISNITGY